MSNNQEKPTKTQYSLEEVSKHNKEGDAWIIIDGKIYDISKFAALHPGGKLVILEHAGQDATKVYEQFHPMRTLTKYPKLVIGTLEGFEKRQYSLEAQGTDYYGEQVPFADPNWYQGWQSPYYNESHRKFRDAIRRFIREENYEAMVDQWEESGEVPQSVFRKLGEEGYLAGLASVPYPKEYAPKKIPGGIKAEDWDWFHYFILLDEFSRVGSSGASGATLGGLGIGLPPILHFGSDEMKKRIVSDVLLGKKFISLAITEPYVGSDVANIKTTAKLSDDGKYYIVNGIKKWITYGYFSDYFTVAVRTGGKGNSGLSMLLIEADRPGFTRRRMKVQGIWSSGTGYLVFENVKVPVENLIGEENNGFFQIMSNFNQERFGIIVSALSSARLAYEDAFKYAHKRKTFGKRLIDHGVIRQKFGHMIRVIESTQAWAEQMAYQLNKLDSADKLRLLPGPISILKVQCSQCVAFVASEAVQVFGGLGYTRGGQGARVERIYREVKANAILGGSEEVMLDVGVRMASRYYPKHAKL